MQWLSRGLVLRLVFLAIIEHPKLPLSSNDLLQIAHKTTVLALPGFGVNFDYSGALMAGLKFDDFRWLSRWAGQS